MTKRGRTTAVLVATVLAACLALAGCSTKHPRFSENLTEIIDPISSFSATSLQDWKDLGDAIVAAQVTAERPDGGSASEPAGANGVYGRLIDVQVLQTYWQRGPRFTPPQRFTTKALGYVLHGNQEQPIVARGEPRLEKGHVYLLVIARFGSTWAGLGNGAEVPFDNGTIGVGEWDGRDKNVEQPAIDSLLGDNAAQLQAAINRTQPDPRAALYDNLTPDQRAKKLGIGK